MDQNHIAKQKWGGEEGFLRYDRRKGFFYTQKIDFFQMTLHACQCWELWQKGCVHDILCTAVESHCLSVLEAVKKAMQSRD